MRYVVALVLSSAVMASAAPSYAADPKPLQGKYVPLVKYLDTGRVPGAKRFMTFVRPVATPGWFYVGQLGLEGDQGLKGDETGLVVRVNPAWTTANPRAAAPLAAAKGWVRSWGISDRGGSGFYRANFTLSKGYQALGDVFAATDRGVPTDVSDDYRLVRDDCLVAVPKPQWVEMWTDRGSGTRDSGVVNGANVSKAAVVPYTRSQSYGATGLTINAQNRWHLPRTGDWARPQSTLNPNMIEIEPYQLTPNSTKLSLLSTYAPLVKLAKGEEYLPCSTEFLMKHSHRAKDKDGHIWLVSNVKLKDPGDDTLPLFKGDIANAPVYAYWSEHSAGVNLVYFFFYGYNRGKQVAGSIYGNHMGDIEHIVVRLERSGSNWAPTKAYYAWHGDGDTIPWNKVVKSGTTHPIVYPAKGSHGCYPTAGPHNYGKAIGTDLIDNCSDGGPQWQTWNKIVALDYNAEANLNGGQYPNWMGQKGTKDFNAHAIYRWGNPRMAGNPGDKLVTGIVGIFKPSAQTDVRRFDDGPIGPAFKNCWGVLLD